MKTVAIAIVLGLCAGCSTTNIPVLTVDQANKICVAAKRLEGVTAAVLQVYVAKHPNEAAEIKADFARVSQKLEGFAGSQMMFSTSDVLKLVNDNTANLYARATLTAIVGTFQPDIDQWAASNVSIGDKLAGLQTLAACLASDLGDIQRLVWP